MGISNYLRELRKHVGNMPLMVPAITALIFDPRGRVLLHRARDDGRWHSIGGSIDPMEQPADAAVREVREETGLHVEPVRVVGVYADPPASYSSGDVALYTSICFECRTVGGEARLADDESLELGWFAADELPTDLPPLDREKILHALRRESRAQFHWRGKSDPASE